MYEVEKIRACDTGFFAKNLEQVINDRVNDGKSIISVVVENGDYVLIMKHDDNASGTKIVDADNVGSST